MRDGSPQAKPFPEGWVSLQHPWARPETGENCNTLQRSGGCPPAGTLDRDPHHAAVLPLDLFDQPTIQSIGQLSDEPSLAALDDLSADPSPLLDALEEMAATNDRFLMLLVV